MQNEISFQDLEFVKQQLIAQMQSLIQELQASEKLVDSYKQLSQTEKEACFRNDSDSLYKQHFMHEQFRKLLNTLQLELFVRCSPQVIAEVASLNPEIAQLQQELMTY